MRAFRPNESKVKPDFEFSVHHCTNNPAVNIATVNPVLSAEQHSHILSSERNEAIIVKKNTAISGAIRNRHSFSISGGVS